MKGFIIFEDFIHFITCKETLDGDYNRVTGASCAPKDTYDFEVGALIALMKMCGFDKSYKAIDEAFSEDTFKTYATKYEREFNRLKHEYDLCKNSVNEYEEEIHALKEEAKRLKGESENHWKKYQRNVQKKQDRINELEAQIKASEDDKLKNIEYYEKEIKNLNYRLTCKDVSLEAKDKKISIYEKRILALEAENEKLKLDCEKLQHGYIDTDMMFCGGRTCGKQYTFLRNLFKWIPMDKVDAAYKEAYNTNLPLWQKEVLKQMYEIHEESTKEKTIKRNDQLDSLIEGSKYAIPYADKWTKSPTKREEMWAEIFELHKESDVIIKVKKEDVNAFLHEIENKIPEITWLSCVKIFETKYTIGDIYEELKTRDAAYFRLWKDNRLTYSSNTHVYPYRELKHIDYLPPMRWDLFKKGRLAVKVTYKNYKEFYEACEKELGEKPSTYFSSDYTVSICKKDGCFEVFTVEHQKKTGRKIVDWEDVR